MLKQILVTRFQRLQNANKESGIQLFFFSIVNVDLQNQLITGIFYDIQDHRWKKGVFGYPDIFYFCGGIPRQLRSEYQQFIAALKVKECKFLNYSIGFNKWHIYKLLAQKEEIRPYLPETKLYASVNDVTDMLNAHGTVYLKGCHGQKGKQVIRVKKISANRYEYKCYKNRLRIGKVNLKKLTKLLSIFFRNEKFIIQQAISLRDIRGRKIDMRAEMQRTGNGELVITGISVRLGRVGSPITTHSSSYRFADYLSGNGSRVNNTSEYEVNDFLFLIYSAVEAGYGPLGELGIDFALDINGRLWFIECNSHPTKVSLMKAYDEKIINQAFCNTLAYAQFLVGGKNSVPPINI